MELKKLPDESIDLVLTDPPYGDNFAYGRLGRTIQGNENPLLGIMAVEECYRLLKENTNAYMFLDVKHLPFIYGYFEKYSPFKIKDVVVWDKKHFTMGHGFRRQHEMILVLEKGKPEYKSASLGNVISVQRVSTTDHPHKKPEELIRTLIEHSCPVGGVVLDPFAGSGTTPVAAKTCGRHYLAIELEGPYVEVANSRLSAISGQLLYA